MTGTPLETLQQPAVFEKNCATQSMRSRRLLRPGPATAVERAATFQRFPFSLVYAIRGGDVEILAVAHGRRRPGYWRSRL
jgi:hypothetical protein